MKAVWKGCLKFSLVIKPWGHFRAPVFERLLT